jgi:predicted ATPase/DNA-binding SARP family transcriptional activator
VEIRVLGPVEVVGSDGPVSLGASKLRRLLAALTIRAGYAVTADVLIDSVWGAAPPKSAPKLLQVYVSQLRKLLKPPVSIETRGAGYALKADDSALDAARFQRLLVDGRAASGDGNHALAASLFARALGLWRGSAYGEFAYEEFARGEAELLEELRLQTCEERMDAKLALGHQSEVLPELRSLVLAQPLRERLPAQLMVALYRSGRQSEALAVYAAAYARLRDQLGLEPSGELHELQRRILRHDTSLNLTPSRREPAVVLPVSPNPLLGREHELDELDDLLGQDDVRLLVLTGAGGSGKTRLAIDAARRAEHRFANGVIFVPLATVADPERVPAAIADASAVQPAAGQAILQTLSVAFRSQELLLVLDNAEHVRAAAPAFVELLAQVPRLKLLVTSRVVLHLSGEHVYPVRPLDARAAADLFRIRVAAADPTVVLEAEQEQAITEICTRLDGLPLAVELAAGRTRTHTPSELLARLERRLPLLAGGPRDLPARQQTLRATLEWSHELLNDCERQAFRRVSVFPADATLEAIEAVCETTSHVIGSLVDHSLINRVATAEGSRFHMHETIREFAVEERQRSPDNDLLPRRHAHYVLEAADSWRSQERGHPRYQGGRFAAVHPDDTRAALRWALAAHDALAPRLAVAAGRHWHALGRLADGRSSIEAALALEHGDDGVRSELLGLLAAVLYDSGNAMGADRALTQALSLARRTGDERIEGWLRTLHAEVQVAFGRPLRDSLAECEAAVLLLEGTGDDSRLADSLVVLGRLRFWAGQRPGEADALERAVVLARETQNRAAELLALESLALQYVNLREPTDRAIAEQERLLEAAWGAPRAEAGILMSLAWLYQYAGRLEDARATLARSRAMFQRFGVAVEWAAGARTAGAIELLAGNPAAAERQLREACHRLTGVDESILASLIGWLAEALYAQGRHDEAASAAVEARNRTPKDDREVHVRSRAVEAKVRAHRNEADAAERLLCEAAGYLTARALPPHPPPAFWTTTLPKAETLSPTLVGTLLLARGEALQLLGEANQAAAMYLAARDLYRNKNASALAERAQGLLDRAVDGRLL